jgi:hypothetical protein
MGGIRLGFNNFQFGEVAGDPPEEQHSMVAARST